MGLGAEHGVHHWSLGEGPGWNAMSTLRGLMWQSTNTTRKTPTMGTPGKQRKTKEFSCGKALMLHCDPWHAHRTKDPALANTKQGWVSCHLQPSLEAERPVHDSQRWKARGYCLLGPRDCISHQAMRGPPVTNHTFLGSARSATPETSSPEEMHGPPGTVLSRPTKEAQRLGSGRCMLPCAWQPHVVHPLQVLPHVPVVLVCSGPPCHSTPEPVSPKKWPLSPLKRGLQAEEANPRQSKAERTASKWQVQQIKIFQLETVHLRGNCRLWEQVHAGTSDCLTQNSLHTAHNNVKDVPAYVGGSFEQATQLEKENRGITQFFSLLLLLIFKI